MANDRAGLIMRRRECRKPFPIPASLAKTNPSSGNTTGFGIHQSTSIRPPIQSLETNHIMAKSKVCRCAVTGATQTVVHMKRQFQEGAVTSSAKPFVIDHRACLLCSSSWAFTSLHGFRSHEYPRGTSGRCSISCRRPATGLSLHLRHQPLQGARLGVLHRCLEGVVLLFKHGPSFSGTS